MAVNSVFTMFASVFIRIIKGKMIAGALVDVSVHTIVGGVPVKIQRENIN